MLRTVRRLTDLNPSVLEGFSCGDEWMDDWLVRKAPRQLGSGLCAMHVGLDESGSPVGFFTLSTCQIVAGSVPKRERHGINAMPFGAFLIGEIAVRCDLRGSGGYGTLLLNHAICRACDLALDAGASFVVVDPRGGDEQLAAWYEHRGFRCLPQSARHYLPMKEARALVDKLGEDYFLFA